MKLSDKEIDNLLANSQFEDVIEMLKSVVLTPKATMHDYFAFIKAVADFYDRNNYILAYQVFMTADGYPNQDEKNKYIRAIYQNIEPIIKNLGMAYFDNNNTFNIPKKYYYRARFYLFASSGRLADAVLTLSKSIDEFHLAEDYYQRSKIYIMQKQYKKALADLDAAIGAAPNNAEFYFNRGLIKQRIYDIKGALFDLDNAVNLNENNYFYYYSRGMLYESLEKYKNAIDDFKKTIQLKTDNSAAFTEIAWCYHKFQKPKYATSFINIAIALDVDNANGYYVRGCIKNDLKQYEDAVRDLTVAINKDNRSDKLWSSKIFYQKAWAEFMQKNYAEAQKDITEAIKYSNRTVPYYMLAMDIEYFGIQDYYKARGYCQEILRLDPDNTRASLAQQQIISKIGDNI